MAAVTKNLDTIHQTKREYTMRKAIARTARRSRTLRGGLLAVAGTLAGFFNDAVAIGLEAAAQATMLAPMIGLGASLGLETRTVSFSIALAGIALSMFSRLHDASTGANSK